MFKTTILNITAIMTFIACSSVSNESATTAQPVKLSDQQEREQAIEATEYVTNSLEQLVIDSKEKGDDVIDYIASDLFLKATDASFSGDPMSAALILKYVVELRPNDIYLRKKYAVELIKSNQLEAGKKELQYLVKYGDKDIQSKSRLLLAGVYGALGENENSKKLYKKLVYKTRPIISEACTYLSKTYVEEGKVQKAVGVLSYCSSKDKGNRGLYTFNKGKIYFDKSEHKTAKKYFKQSIKFDPTLQQSVALLGMIYKQEGAFLAAKKIYKNFLGHAPNSYTVLGKYVNLLFADGEFVEVVPYLEKLLALDPENLNLKVRLGVIYTETNKFDDAIAVFKEILKEIPDSDKVLYYLGSLYQKKNDGDLAVTFYSKINDESTLFHESNIQIANILNTYAQADTTKEKALYNFVSKAGRKKELQFELDVIFAGFLEHKKEISRAISLIESHQKSEQYTDGHAYYLASLYEKDKSFKKAETIMLSLLEKDPNNSHVLNFLGYTYLEQGVNMEKAYLYIKKAVELNPKDGYIRDSLGWYYYKTGEFKKAYKEIRKAFELVSDDVVIAKHLGLIYTSMNQPEKARQYYVEALKNCTRTNERQDILNYLEKLDSARLPASR